MATILVRVDDLMLSSKVAETLRSAGHVLAAPATPEDELDLVVCDLDAVAAEQVAAMAPPAIGFYQHTDVETKRTGDAAGLELVVPRSRMARELPQLVEKVLAG